MSEVKTAITPAEPNALESSQNQLTMSERFTSKVLQEYGGSVAGALEVTDYQRTLISGYFIGIDRALKAAEEERLRKNATNKDRKYDNELPVTWKNVNLNDLALDLVHFARMGLDMTQKNMLFAIPFKNNKRGCYDVTLMEGYNGIRYIAEKYAVETPVSVTVEVVYSTDSFKPIKKDAKNRVESYEFTINNAFERGEIVGGFAYLEFSDPLRNTLIFMSMKDIQKRKPKYASANFWGGKQKVWENGKQVEVEVEGWVDEMVRKTLIREAYSAKYLPRDPKKIDDSYQHMKRLEARYAELEAQAEISANANTVLIDTSVDADTGEITETAEELPPIANAPDF